MSEHCPKNTSKRSTNPLEPSPKKEIANQQAVNGDKSQLLEKLNYMITLLEEQKEHKTDNITEELILYMFLGVFVIFVVDSFARVTKYTR